MPEDRTQTVLKNIDTNGLRKREHLRINLEEDVQFKSVTTGFEDVVRGIEGAGEGLSGTACFGAEGAGAGFTVSSGVEGVAVSRGAAAATSVISRAAAAIRGSGSSIVTTMGPVYSSSSSGLTGYSHCRTTNSRPWKIRAHTMLSKNRTEPCFLATPAVISVPDVTKPSSPCRK